MKSLLRSNTFVVALMAMVGKGPDSMAATDSVDPVNVSDNAGGASLIPAWSHGPRDPKAAGLAESTVLTSASKIVSATAIAGATYYVDFDAGSDTASGLSTESPWKHAPGDPNAAGNPAQAKLNPGDMVLFKGGVVYRGSITVPASGSAGKPITYEGTGWGSGRAILSGLDAHTLNFAPYGTSSMLSVATLATPIDYSNIVEIDGVRQWLSAYPALGSSGADPNQIDAETIPFDVNEMQGQVPNWTLTDPALAKKVSTFAPDTIPNLSLRVYDNGNWNNPFSVTGFDPSTGALSLKSTNVHFSMSGLKTSHYHLFNNPALINAANQYAVENNGTQLVAKLAPGSHVVELSQRGVGIDVHKQSYVKIDGFTIANYTGNQTAYYSGIGVLLSDSTHIIVTNNKIVEIAMWAGLFGGIFVPRGTDVTVDHNEVGPIFMGRGIGFGGTHGMEFSDNHVTDTDGTAVDFYAVQDAVISFNRVDHIATAPGAHAEGFALYDNSRTPDQGTRNVRLINNQLDGTTLMFAGNSRWSNPAPGNVLIANNVVTNNGIHSQGGALEGVKVKGNIAMLSMTLKSLAPNPCCEAASAFSAVYSHGGSTDLTVENNIFDGYLVSGDPGTWPPGWVIMGNTLTYQYDPRDYKVLPGDTFNTSLRPTVVSALAVKGQLPSSLCAILEPDGAAVQIGIDYSCAPAIRTRINGACGDSAGGSFLSAPATSLCTTGAASPVAGHSGEWRWSCAGSNGGSTASCSAAGP